jgi:hypothetical protein
MMDAGATLCSDTARNQPTCRLTHLPTPYVVLLTATLIGSCSSQLLKVMQLSKHQSLFNFWTATTLLR